MYTVIDIETTGLSKHLHQITEIAAVKIRDNQIVDSFQTLVNPKTRIPRFITKLTGIDNRLVENAPTIKQVLPSFKDFLGNDIIVAHNATFDYGFIAHNLNIHQRENLFNHKLCTRKLANRLLPDLPRKRLSDLCEYFQVQNEQAHRAMGDVQATVEVFNRLLNLLKEKNICEINEILKFEKANIKRIQSK